ncbi:hypothetical protein BDV25DRAFT_156969 [Aspergillus avenaceus]|uniref:Uncharacterized protein n=1 Tax=Aspergillus avenaceus TaxID=36643 RepID=A0A5N6TS07_ASPAV|nr:hypothetical protein BDV25DRAFT_156969 [Aspergillus avenaceus]
MRLLGVTLASAALAVAQRATTTTSSTSSGTAEPCAVASQRAEKSQNVVPAQVAYECLTSVPVAVDENKKLIDQLKMMWEWHSETGYLKNTPDTWELGSIDLLGELDKIKDKLSSYDSEYDVQVAIHELTLKTGNFHFQYLPDILQVFSFQRLFGITTISKDGTTVPEIYVASDIYAKEAGNSTKISPISKINGEDVEKFLEKVAAYEQYIDPDARFNSLMYKGNETSSRGGFEIPNFSTVYQGAMTNVTFKNDTTRSVDNAALTRVDLDGITDGKTFFEQLCTGEVFGADTDSLMKRGISYKGTPTHWKRASIPSSGYPKPIVKHSSDIVAGYFMSTSGYDDVAVLKITSFSTDTQEESTEFQSVMKQFLGNATEANKKKLVIDLRENGGGDTDLLLDTFRQLFPGDVPFSAQRYRAQNQYKLVGDAVNSIYESSSAQALITKLTGQDYADFGLVRYWAFWNFVDVNGKTFKSWEDFYGPHTYNGDNFTTIMRYNMSNSNPVSILDEGVTFTDVSGDPPFAAEDIVMLSDGLCGSSCASFHEELKNIAGVKAVAIGGRPQEGAMQTIGGSKGGEVIPIETIPSMVKLMMNATDLLGSDVLDQPSLQDLVNTDILLTRAGGSSRIQVQDQIRKGDESGIPLQYIYEDADCRIFYTTKTLMEPEAAWAATWSAYTDDSKCVKGSTKKSSSLSGGYKPFGPGGLDGKQEESSSSSGDDKENSASLLRPSLAVCAAATLMSFML